MNKKGVDRFIIGIAIIVGIVFTSLESSANNLSRNYSFKQISYEQGFPGINVLDQIQDEQGIMWFCIESIGFCRYDGHKFILHQNDENNPNTISSNFVKKAIEDLDGNFWLATDNGLNYYSRKTAGFTQFYFDLKNNESLPHNNCHSILIDKEGDLWIGTENGLARKKKNSTKFERFLYESDSSTVSTKISIFNVCEYGSETLWLGTDNGLIKFDKVTGNFTKWLKTGLTKNEPVHNQLNYIYPDSSGYLWIGTHRGLDRFNIKTEKFEHWRYNDNDLAELEFEGISSIKIDHSGNAWIGTYSKGIVLINTNSEEYIRITSQDNSDHPIRSDHIRYLFEDRMGIIWVGTKYEGVFFYNDKINIFNNWPKSLSVLQSLKSKYLLSFFEDQNHVYWVGTKQDGLFKVNRNSGETINYVYNQNNKSGISSNRVNAIFRDSEKKLWIGTTNGLNQLNERNNQFSTINDLNITCIFEDNSGTLWIGTTMGLYILDSSGKKLLKPAIDIDFFQSNKNETLQILEDSKQTIWFSTRNQGLHSYNKQTKSYRHYKGTDNDSLLIIDDMTRGILEDKNSNLWIGTKTKGLFRLNRETSGFTSYTIENGLTNNMAFCLETDHIGNIWIGTLNGISRFDPIDKTFTNFNSDYGLKSNAFEFNVSHSFSGGELLFGGNEGFYVFDPLSIKQNQVLAPLVFTSFKINETEHAFSEFSNKKIKLKHNQNYLTIEFSLTDYNNPRRHQYAVFLKGVDQNWTNIGNRNFVTYTNLENGSYELSVKGANEYGTWTEIPITISFSILPPFYKSLWFRFILFISIILLGYAVYVQMKIQKQQLEKMINERTGKLEVAYKELLHKNQKIREQNRLIEQHHAELELKVSERTKDLEIAKQKAEESDKLKSSFLANMSHEIRTPLNAITGFSTLVSSDLYSLERKQKYVNIIKANATSLLKLVEDILDLSKIEAGQLKIEKEFFDFNAMIAEIYAIFQEEIKLRKKNSIKFECTNLMNDDPIRFYSDQIRIRQVLVNLISNAIKFTSIGKVEFGYKILETKILFWVRDTGIGIKPEALTSIFERFTKIEGKKTRYAGTGLGLSISKSLVDMLGGKIWVESEFQIGSNFYFEIPGLISMVKHYEPDAKRMMPQKLNLKNRSVLIVEDEKSNYELLHSYLHSTEIKIVWAQDGFKAEEYCKKENFDFILLDIRMPEIDGYETLKLIRKISPETPIIAQTAYALPTDERKLNQDGFDAILIKPFLREELFSKMANFID